MPTFQYEAVTATGQRNTGNLDAADRGEAIRKLSRRGLQPHAVKILADAAPPREKSKALPAAAKPAHPLQEKPKSKDKAREKEKEAREGAVPRLVLKRRQVIQFTEELTDLLTAGLQLEQALHAMENRSSVLMSSLSTRLRELVRDGVPFSTALSSVSASFGELYCSLVAAGEASGSLTKILARQARYLNAMEAIRGKVAAALIYPSFIVASGLALATVFITYLMPKLIVLIQSTGGKMPALASFLMGVSNFLTTWWWAILLAIILTVVTVKILLQDGERRKAWHRITLNLPVYGPLLRTRFEVQFLETLGNLLTNGLPINRGLELVRKTTMNLFLRERLGTLELLVGDGSSLSRSLERTEIARPLVLDMIRVGEQTGDLPDALRKAAERFDRQLTKVVDNATAALQPVIILGMAGMVGTMAWMMISVVYSTLENLNRH